jgi:predicted permease
MLSDLKYALRQLAKSPGFTTVAVLCLALCIGVNATMFWFVRAMVLQPLIRDRQQHLVSFYTASQGANRDFRGFSYPEFGAIRASHEICSDLAAYGFETCVVGRSGSFRHSLVGLVSENYFSVLQVRAWRGRFFSAEEARPNSHFPVAIASYSLWQRLGQPVDLIGSTIRIKNEPYVVIGIAPADGASSSAIGPDVWLPLGMAQQIWGGSGDALGAQSYPLRLIGSFQSGVSFDNARDRLTVVNRQLNAPPLGDPSFPRELILTPPPRFDLGTRPANENFLVPFAVIATALAMSVLLVASLNLANMLMARGVTRQKEIAIRLSLGATRWQIVRQLLIESFLLALAGGVIGKLFGVATGFFLRRLSAGDFAAARFNFTADRTTDWLDIAMIAALCLGSAMAFGFGPALRITRVNLVEDLKRQPGQPADGGQWNRSFSLRHCLMMAQIAFSFVLLFSAGLFVRGSQKAIDLDPGFVKSGGFVVNLDYVDPNLSDDAIARREQALLIRSAALPGVTSAALASSVPFNFETNWWRIFPAGSDASAINPADQSTQTAPFAVFTVISRGYFETLGIPLLKGRDFTAAESSQQGGHLVAIIDETLARALFGDQEPVGRRVATSSGNADGKHPDREIEIVGIIRSPHEDPFEPAAPHRFYRPLGQRAQSNIYLHVKVADPSATAAVLDRLRRDLTALDPDTPILLAQPLSDFVDKNLNLLLVRLAGIVFGASGLVALMLAVIGVYGLKAHAIVRRTREIGIRIALGAKPADVLALVLKQGVQQTVVGLAAGLVLALAAGQLAARMLYRVSPFDPFALVGAAMVLAATVLLACYLPARRATKINPAITLRSE